MDERSSNEIMLQAGGDTNREFLSCIKLSESTANIFAQFLQSNPAHNSIQRPRVESQTKALQIKSLNRKIFSLFFFFSTFGVKSHEITQKITYLQNVDEK